jgi:hypothetical protein
MGAIETIFENGKAEGEASGEAPSRSSRLG